MTERTDPRLLLGSKVKLALLDGPSMFCASYRHPSFFGSNPDSGYECKWHDSEGWAHTEWYRPDELELDLRT